MLQLLCAINIIQLIILPFLGIIKQPDSSDSTVWYDVLLCEHYYSYSNDAYT